MTAVGRWCCTTRAWAVGFSLGSSALATGGIIYKKNSQNQGEISVLKYVYLRKNKDISLGNHTITNWKKNHQNYHEKKVGGKSKSANQHCWKLFTKVSTVSFIWSWEFNTGGKVINISYTKNVSYTKKKRNKLVFHKEGGKRKDLEFFFLSWAGNKTIMMWKPKHINAIT